MTDKDETNITTGIDEAVVDHFFETAEDMELLVLHSDDPVYITQVTLEEYAQGLSIASELDMTLRELNEELESTPVAQKIALIQDKKKQAKSIIENAKTRLQNIVVEFCEKNKIKTFLPGLTVKDETVYEYDEKEMTAWALKNLPGALILDKKKFETYLDNFEVPGAKVKKVPKPYITNDKHKAMDAAQAHKDTNFTIYPTDHLS